MKILSIGLPRTGSYSLCKSLNLLKFSCIHYPRKIQDHSAATEVVFDYSLLEKEFPNSLYIYTKRDLDSWMTSCLNFFTKDFHKKYENKIIIKKRFGSKIYI